ncbi:MAG: ABC transporter substrate-binding protein, partial [Actinomycetota bacterium]|nr:ABC transporter substrate-binding protein [Actinomycetota bacterium]
RILEDDEPAFELVTHDDAGDPALATRLVQELASSDRTVGVVYAGPSEGLPPAEDALAAGGIPAILNYGDLYSARLLSPHVFQATPAYLWQARVIARYLVLDRRYSRIGILSEDSLAGETARRSLTTALADVGGRVADASLVPKDLARVGRALRPLRRRRVQAIVVEGSPATFEATLETLRETGATYRTTRAAKRRNPWRPQVIGFDSALSPGIEESLLTPGVAAADSYARGAHYLPIPSFERFHRAFVDWWDSEPYGWERRAFESVQMIGWAARRVPTGKATDVARVLEKMRNRRFGGLDVTFGPDDHTSVDQTTVGLWVVPRGGIKVRERDEVPRNLPWVLLARTFSIDEERTDVLPEDWKWLFRGAPPKNRPAPKIRRSLYGVITGRNDPIH